MKKVKFNSNILIILGVLLIGYILISGGIPGIGGGDGGGILGTHYNVECRVTVSNPLFGSAYLQNPACSKKKVLFCGSPISIITADFNLKLKVGSNINSIQVSDYGIPGTGGSDYSISACGDGEISQVELTLSKDNSIKDTKTIGV